MKYDIYIKFQGQDSYEILYGVSEDNCKNIQEYLMSCQLTSFNYGNDDERHWFNKKNISYVFIEKSKENIFTRIFNWVWPPFPIFNGEDTERIGERSLK